MGKVRAPTREEWCDFSTSLLSLGLSQGSQALGLPPLRAGTGFALDLNPGFAVTRLVNQVCQGKSLKLDLSGLPDFAQDYLTDRLEDLAHDLRDKRLGIPGNRIEFPTIPLGFISLPGNVNAVLWLGDEQGKTRLKGLMIECH